MLGFVRLLIVAAVLLVLFAFAPSRSDETTPPPRLPRFTVPGLYRGDTASVWAARFRWRTSQLQRRTSQLVRRTRQLHRMRRVLLADSSVGEAIELAGATYGSTSTLWRRASCESTLDPGAQNSSGASGLFQFLPSTWATTPYARFSIWSPYANALAAGWMNAHGRSGEWVCR